MSHFSSNPQVDPYRSTQKVSIFASEGLWNWLDGLKIGLAFTTYQSNRLFLIGRKPDGRLGINERLFDKPMGLYSSGNTLYMACRYQIWQLENRLNAEENHFGCDRLYIPSVANTTGDLNVHDLVKSNVHELVFVNTDFSCIATLHPDHSFKPLWQPPFISKLVAEDRCHLNGLALQDGKPAFVTACSSTDTAAGWRDHRVAGGVVVQIATNEIVATGLSMPHSPRWRRGKLWLLNSGTGEFGYIDNGRFIPVTYCPGFVRGLAFTGDYAVVGLSKLRSKTFAGLPLETRLAAINEVSQCGLRIIDMKSGEIVHSLHIEGVVEELFDIVVLPNVRLPRALGFQDNDIERLINFPGSNGMVITRPTVNRPGAGKAAQITGLPRTAQLPGETGYKVKYQRVYHMNSDNLLAYEAMTYPSLCDRWQTQPQRGELIGVSASVNGEMIGLAIAEKYRLPDSTLAVDLLSWFVASAWRGQGIGRNLTKQLEKQLGVTFELTTAAKPHQIKPAKKPEK